MNETTPTNSQVDGSRVDLVSAALVECQGKLKSANMDATNPFFKSKYATLGAVIEASREALYGAGLALQQNVTLTGGIVSVHTIIRHKSGQSLDGGTLELPIGENDRNSDAQVAGSIMTYLKRYAWASVLGIYADEDSDGNEAPKGAVARQPYQKPQSANPPAKTTPEAHQDAQEVNRRRLKMLNSLKAAPGQPMRVLVTHFAMSKGWINGTQELEQIPAEHVPTTETQAKKLAEEVAEFEGRQREGGVA